MKVCLLSDTYPPDVGGLAVSAQRTAQNLAGAGLDIHVTTLSGSRPPGSWTSEADGAVTVHRLGAHPRMRATLTEWFELTAELDKAQGFDLFHGHFVCYAGYVAATLARYHGKRSVVSARGNDLDVMPFDDRRAPFVFKALETADAVVAVTHDLARKAAALSGRQDLRVIHNGVDPTLFAPREPDPALRAEWGLDERPVIGFIGEARAKKGLGRLLRIYPQLYQRIPAQLLLVGGVRKEDRPMVEFFQRGHPDLPLHLVPPRPNSDMPHFYALCDLVVLPSLRDGLPNTLLEAMACARPVVASAVGGMLDVLTDRVDGITLPPRDDDAWTNTLYQMLMDPQTCQELGTAARHTACTRFTVAGEREAWLALYRELSPAADHKPPATAHPPGPR
jgi:phosphatidylinositol alpha-1,6-mannosyltransferase